jgi:hypothetical protein
MTGLEERVAEALRQRITRFTIEDGELDDAVADALSALESQGLKIVPVEPTEEMWHAANGAMDSARAVDVLPSPDEIYAAMLNAVEG